MKIHKKLYKAKKQWCCMALAATVASVGIALAPNMSAYADTGVSTDNAAVAKSTEEGQNNKSATLHSVNNQTSTDTIADQNNQSSTENQQATTDQKMNESRNSNSQSNPVKNDVVKDSNNISSNKSTNDTTKSSPVHNGWTKNNQGQMTYYQKGQAMSGRQYVELPTIPNTGVKGDTNWYLVDNGVAQSGLQKWQGSHYYFDPKTYLVVKNDYVVPADSDAGYLLGKDGIALNGIQKWQGTYYAFDYDTYRLVKNQKFNEWGNTYQIDNQGRVASGLYKDANDDVYYYNPSSYLAETNTYIVPTGTQNGYLFGKDGKALSGVQKWQGTYYYFDPETKQLVRNDYVKSQWGLWYMVGPNGALVTGPYNWQGSTYYFDESSYLRVDNDYRVPAGADRGYLLGSDGRALSGLQEWQGNYWYFDPQTHLLVKNTYVDPDSNDSGYLLAPDGHALTGIQKWQGTYYAFDYKTHRLVKNEYFKSQWGLSYQIDDKGRVVSGYYKDANGDVYYYDPSSYLRATNTYMVPAGTQNGYLFGKDGKALSGVQKWQGTYYYFDPATKQLVRNKYVKSQWGLWYMVGPEGSLVTGQYNWQGSTYYFDPSSYVKDTNKWVNGQYYGADGIRYQNRLAHLGGNWYLFDNDGNLVKNTTRVVNGLTIKFDQDGKGVAQEDPSDIRTGLAENIATQLQQQGYNIYYDWKNQDHNYQELAMHDMAQMIAQGDVTNDNAVINKLLQANDLINGHIIQSQLVDVNNGNYNAIADSFVNSISDKSSLNNAVLGVGFDWSNKKVAMLLYKVDSTGKQVTPTTNNATSSISGTVQDVYKAAGVKADVQNGLKKGDAVDSNLNTGIDQLLTGERGTKISDDVLKAIFASLPGNSTALDGTKNYSDGSDNYHYEYWLEGQSSDDKLNNFLNANKGAKYGDALKVNYSATLTYGNAVQPSTTTDETPASQKTDKEIALAYQTGSETGLRYDSVKVEKIPGMTDDTIRGVDISSYQALVNAGVKFYDFNGNEASIYQVLKDAGVNWVRIRVWNDPFDKEGHTYSGGDNSESNLIKMASDASKAGLKVLVDFQYSDFWTDPAQQILPKAWKQLSNNEVQQEVGLYTAKVMADLKQANANVQMVQIGNEITNGAFGLYTGRNGGGDWSSLWKTADGNQVAKDIQSGSEAVRKADPNIKIAVQLETPSVTAYRGIMTVLKNNNVDYDYLGTSYYAFWGTKQGNGWYDHQDLGYGASTPINLEAVEDMAWKEFGKRTVILESGWINNTNDADGTHNSVGGDNDLVNIDAYPATPQGQVDAISDMYKANLAKNGLGAFYWEPAWIPVRAGWNNWQYNNDMSDIYGTGWANKYAVGYAPDSVLYYKGQPAWGGSSWDNVSLFDDHGHPLQSLNMFKGFLNGYQTPEVAKQTSSVNVKIDKIYNNTDVTPNDGLATGSSVDGTSFTGTDTAALLNGHGTISADNLDKIAASLKDGVKSKEYTAANGATYHYVFWLEGQSAADKASNFATSNVNAKYGDNLTASYSATVVVDSEPTAPVKPVNPTKGQKTSSVAVKVNKIYNNTDVTPNDGLAVGSTLDASQFTSDSSLLTGNGSISADNLKSIAGTLKDGVKSKTYTAANGAKYHYVFWLDGNNATVKATNFATQNNGAKYGNALTANYSATLVVDSDEPGQPTAKTVTSPVTMTVSEVYNSINGTAINADGLLKVGDTITSADMPTTTLSAKTVTDLLSGPEGTSISSANLTQLENTLKSSGIDGTKTYTTSDGNVYYYQFWLQNIKNWDVKYGQSVQLEYSAALKWKGKATDSQAKQALGEASA